ncbi:hypothetical protein C6Y45_12745 [Alkalicoccus saliphilus]|jgi:hypothetical protein|uniref:Uncharacterized protein n=1 Tax=Alkalicoccus saliphilus TaxID=200989 RepID=A0A2T4U466_9BACI|nr:hypothetical protein C6Y45_12745 [Alkalicoccus saliphilus]
MEERAESTRFFEKKTSFYVSAGAEAGPPGKRPVEAKAGRCLRLYKKYSINSLKSCTKNLVQLLKVLISSF